MNHQMIICDRYDIKGIINGDDLMSEINPKYFVHFFESYDNRGNYLIKIGNESDGRCFYQHLNNIGKCDFGDGCGRANVLEPFSIGILNFQLQWRFTDFIHENHVIEKHSCHLVLGLLDSSWFKFDSFQPGIWFDKFLEIESEKQKLADFPNLQDGCQLELF